MYRINTTRNYFNQLNTTQLGNDQEEVCQYTPRRRAALEVWSGYQKNVGSFKPAVKFVRIGTTIAAHIR